MTILCLASYYKGERFLIQAKRQGCTVLLLTSQDLQHEPWPWDSIDEVFYMPYAADEWDIKAMTHAVSYVARSRNIERIVALDDFDLEKASLLREHLRVPGMGETRTRFFRDKLAMRMQARDNDVLVPDFVHVLNYDKVRAFMATVPGPWVLKPRSAASAIGIIKIHQPDDLWPILDELGDEQSYYVLEAFVPGDVYHVDGIADGDEVIFSRVHKYADPPMKTSHEGGVFCTHSTPYGSPDEVALQALNKKVMTAFGLRRGVMHTEFIKAHEDGRFYFLETAARVGGAHIAETLEASSGINLWAEWAHLESIPLDEPYTLPEIKTEYSGIVVSLARQEHPDTSAYDDPEIVWRLNKRHHAGLIVHSPNYDRVQTLLNHYMTRFQEDFMAVQPAPDKPTH